jgi:GNAT superfamily N-acetyltransferase
MHVVDFDLGSPPEWLDTWHRLDVDVALETLPGLEPPSPAESRGELRSELGWRRRGLAAIDSGTLVGAITFQEPQFEDLDLAYGWMLVDAAYRRRGVGARLLDASRELLRPDGRRRLHTSVLVDSPAASFARNTGARVTQIELCNAADVTALDLAALRAKTQPRSPYVLASWVDACPDDLVTVFADAQTSMDDAPRGDAPSDASTWTVERLRDQEECWSALGYTALTVAAIHQHSGAVAGYTQLLLTGRPTTAVQEDTGVVRAHRGHGLGLAVKCANLIALTEHSPTVETVVTWNAESNKYMLAVNDAVGFRAHSRWEEFSLDL